MRREKDDENAAEQRSVGNRDFQKRFSPNLEFLRVLTLDHMNDIFTCFDNVEIALHAVDLRIYKAITCQEDYTALEVALDNFSTYCLKQFSPNLEFLRVLTLDHMNDIFTCFDNVEIALHAVDLRIYEAITCQEDYTALEVALNNFSTYCLKRFSPNLKFLRVLTLDHMNDIFTCFDNVEIALHAVDLRIYKAITCQEDYTALEVALYNFSTYCLVNEF
ncbi:hypothetical protein JTB14_022033 [Gonioctena quinquepunctata]|nr:hypothetical protein JTB14_022033 [Gonioctena quinquepunctata]